MTISPQKPNLVDTKENGVKVLVEPHLTFVKVGLGYSLMILIGRGFETDGASIPKNMLDDSDCVRDMIDYLNKKYPMDGSQWDKENLWEFIVGTPWDMPRLLAAIVHDALYGMKWRCRWLCDIIYRKILYHFGYEKTRSDIEYLCVRIAGWKNWENVTGLERDRTREIVTVKLVRNKKIPRIIRQLSG